ncbi:MAG: arginase family protein [Thermoanaerobaculia bacterium]
MSGSTLQILVVPFDVERRDTPMARGPHGLLQRGLADRLGDAGREVRLAESEVPEGLGKLETVAEVGRWIAGAVAAAHEAGRFPLVLSGSCLASLGALTGMQRLGLDPAVVWIDAHGDFNTEETSVTGYWDGMALAGACGLALGEPRERIGLRPLRAAAAVHLAGRAFDPPEAEAIRKRGLAVFPPEGISSAEPRLRAVGDRPLYLHVDLDGLDLADAPAVGFPVPGGPDLEAVLGIRSSLPPPTVLTIAAASLDRAGEDEARRTIATIVRLAEAFS